MSDRDQELETSTAREPEPQEAPSAPVTVTIERLAGGGAGLAHHGGETWLVTGGLPGEQVQAAVTARRQGIVEARTLAVLATPHAARLAQPCPHAPHCGGCDWAHVDPASGAALKAAVAAGAARGLPELAQRLAAAPVKASPARYRLRARLHWDPAGRRLGFFRHRSWQVESCAGCLTLSPRLEAALPSLTEALIRRCPQPADVEWLQSLDGSTAVIALCGTPRTEAELDPDWLPQPADLAGAVEGCYLMGREGHPWPGWGAESVRMELPVPLEVPIGAFFQGNLHLVPWLFDRVAQLAPQLPTWDLHAGVGFLGAAAVSGELARGEPPRPLVLVEPSRRAAGTAARNLPFASVAGGRRVETYLQRGSRLPRTSLAISDPPRVGMSPELRNRLAGWHPQSILTLGCDPATWARDAAFLLGRGYRLTHLELVDLFPFTHHVEVLGLLEAA